MMLPSRTGIAVALALCAQPAVAQDDVAAFYSGKTIEMYVGYGPGGGYDQATRLVGQHIGKHIPGNPDVVVINRPGAGSMTLANELFTTLPQDGLALGMFGNSLHIFELMGIPNISFRFADFGWIGRTGDADDVMVVRPDKGVTTLEQARETELAIGVPGPNTAASLMVRVANSILGTKFVPISGYDGGEEIRLAVEQGEVDGSQSVLWSLEQPWIAENGLTVLYRVGATPLAGMPDVPMLSDIARNDEERQLMGFFTSYTEIGRSLAAPPGLPPERLAALRSAFDATMQDPAFVADAKAANLLINPMPGTDVQAMITGLFDMTDAMKDRAKAAAAIPGQ